ncbi:FAD-dependent monooxygenase [Erythrobacter aureus]|uniref:FAD-dependent monooxygenase n=1 Tax=Erythrobacter aureus TaxID=2182384 RepID=UPI003A9268FC
MSSESNILIVGGGPVGLSMSIQLSRLGVRHTLVERNRGVSPHPKARLVNPRSIELLRLWGMGDAVDAVRVTVDPVFFFGTDLVSPWKQVFRPAEMLATEEAASVSPSLTEGVLCSQDVLEPILRECARSHPEADIRFGWEAEVTKGLGEAGPANAVLRNLADGKVETMTARFIIAADGAASPIRDQLAIEVTGADRTLEAISVLFRADLSPYGGSSAPFFVLSNPDTIGTAVIAPVDEEDRSALLGRPKIMDELPLDEIDWEKVIRDGTGLPDLELEIIDVRAWRAAVAIATEYRRGNTFLVGDSAHVMPPNGGFNMNTGMQDAHNLAWKIAAVLQGWGDEKLLDTYDSERRPVALFNAAEAVRNLKVMVDENEEGRAGGFRQDHYVHPGLALGYRYNNGAIVYRPDQDREDNWPVGHYDNTAVPGARAPHVWIGEAGKETMSTLDLFEHDFILLTTPEAGKDWAPIVKEVGQASSVPLRLVTLGKGGDFACQSGKCADLYGLANDSAVLVRPDGHVGWCAPEVDGDGLRSALDTTTGK